MDLNERVERWTTADDDENHDDLGSFHREEGLALLRDLIADWKRRGEAIRQVDLQASEVFCSHTEYMFCVFCNETDSKGQIEHDSDCVWAELHTEATRAT